MAVAVVGATALAGCSTDSSAGPTVLTPRTPVASVAPAKAPEFPATSEGAAAFARHFFKVLDEAYLTGDSAALAAIVRSDCGSCTRMMGSIKSTYAAGEQYVGGRTTVSFAESPATDGNSAVVDVIYASEALGRVDAAGKVLPVEPAAPRVEATLRIVRTGNRWMVTSYGIVR